jgi:hypothetical protein
VSKDFTFDLSIFGGGLPSSVSEQMSRYLLNALKEVDELWLVIMNREWKKTHKGPLPSLYSMDVVYKKEPASSEKWLDVPKIISKKVADCEDLAAYRAAELSLKGAYSYPDIFPSGSGYHVIVRTPMGNGIDRIEDPSKKLGMKGPVPVIWYYPTGLPITQPPWLQENV